MKLNRIMTNLEYTNLLTSLISNKNKITFWEL